MAINDTFHMTITVKEPDEIQELINVLELDLPTQRSFIEYGEYMTFKLEIDKAMRVVGGRVIPVEEL